MLRAGSQEPREAPSVRVRLSTTAGDILIELATVAAPRTTQAFLNYLDAGGFDEVQFVRTVRHDNDKGSPLIEVIQTMPRSVEIERVSIPHESTKDTGLRHCDGAVSLARASDGSVSPGAFFICIGEQPSLDFGGARNADGLGFAVFGQVATGMDVVRAIHVAPTQPGAPVPYLSGQLLEDPVAIVGVGRESADGTARLGVLMGDYWRFRLREYPSETGGAGDKRHDASLGSGRLADYRRRALLSNAMLKRARAIPVRELCSQDALSLDLLIGQLTTIGDAWRLGDHLTPKLYPFGFTEVPAYLAGSTPLTTIADFERYVARLRALPEFFDGHLETLHSAMSQGYRLPRVLAPRVRGLIEAQLAEDGFAAIVRSRFARRPPGVDAPAFDELASAADKALSEAVSPALRLALSFLDTHGADMLRDTISICDQPNGREYYRFRVRQQTTTDLDPEDIHAIGLEEVAALQSELQRLLEEVGCDGATYSAQLTRSCVEPTAQDLHRRVCIVTKTIDGILPQAFGRLPRITYGVRSFSVEQSRHRPIAMAQAAPADRSLAGVFWITALPERCPTHLLVSLALHEAWPGHLMQFALAHELDHLPAFRRHTSFDYNAYIEGWALYCERLGYDLGLYGDPRDRFGQLTNDLWRATRLVVDTGIHWLGWSRNDAVAYMSRNTFLPHETIEAEVDRYIGMPAQALSYKIGERAIRSLRAEAEARLGSAFSLSNFHDAVLETGAISLNALTQHVRAWIERSAASS